MRELATEDLKAIDEWAETERTRIGKERDQRAAALEEDLATSLTEHGARIDQEVAAVEAVLVAYRADVDRFFARLHDESDPVEIARQARLRPHFPDLDAVSAADPEPSGPAPEPAPVGVMDAEAAADPATAWSRWNEATMSASPESPIAPDAPVGATDAPSPETVPTEATAGPQPATRSLLQSVTTFRAVGGLGGDHREE